MKLFQIENQKIKLTTLNIGAVIYKLEVLIDGKWENMVLNFKDTATYENSPGFIGVGLCGRFAGRIRNGTFKIDGELIELDKNYYNHHIHGGFNGLNKLYGDVKVIGNKIIYIFFDKEKYYPGNINMTVTYTLLENGIRQEINAISDKDTIFNPTNHTYFNFDKTKNILDYTIQLDALDCYYVDEDTLPIEKVNIEKSIFKGITTGLKLSNVDMKNKQFQNTYFIDHAFDITSGKISVYNNLVKMNINTNQKGVVLYTGNYMDEITEEMNIKNGEKHMGLCIETQMVPDCVNQKDNSEYILHEGIESSWVTEYLFEIL